MTWDEYKAQVRANAPDAGSIIDDVEAQCSIISAIIQRRTELGLSQRDLAELCDMPQSSIARIESTRTNPSMATTLRILRTLGLTLTVKKAVKA